MQGYGGTLDSKYCQSFQASLAFIYSEEKPRVYSGESGGKKKIQTSAAKFPLIFL
jgi:hypothetical protein